MIETEEEQLFDAIKQESDEVQDLFVAYIQKHQHDHNYIDKTQRFFNMCVIHEKLDVLSLLLPLRTSDRQLDAALINASYQGQKDTLALLLEHGADATYDYSNALRTAAEKSHIDCVKELIPFANPKDMNSEALQWACYYEYRDMFDLLYLLSDPQKALYHLRKDGLTEYEPSDADTVFLRDRIAQEENALITQCVADKGTHSVSRKM